MNKVNKSILIGGLVGGIINAVFIAGLDYYNGHNFSILKFLFTTLIFGISMGFVTRYNIKKKLDKESKD
jgi:hypothetical protein